MMQRYRPILLVLMIVMLVAPSAGVSAPTPDFSGTWILQNARRQVFAGNRVEIEHKGNQFAVKRWLTIGEKDELSSNIKCAIGGACQVVFDTLQGNSRVSKLGWKAYWEDGKLVTERSTEWRGGSPASQRYIFSLSPDNQTLSVDYVYTEIYKSRTATRQDTRGRGETFKRH